MDVITGPHMRAAFAAIALFVACSTATVTPEQFIADVYARHGRDEPVDAFFEPSLAELIRNGEADFVPLWNAQDMEMTNFVVHPATIEGDRARLDVTFDNTGAAERITFLLARAADGWRISDIAYDDGTTLRGILGRT